MVKKLFIFLFTLLPFYLISQNNVKSCKVLVKTLQETYEGKCKKGLAHGKGIASGIDHYEGKFNKGLPHGKGTYTWQNGNCYVGSWDNGKRSGKGKFVSVLNNTKTILNGYWENNKYIGKNKPVDFKYRIYVGDVKLKYLHLNNLGNTIELSIRRYGNIINESIFDSEFVSDYGTIETNGSEIEFNNVIFPFKAIIQFTISYENIHSNITDFRYKFEIEIFKRGDGIVYIDL